MGMFDNVYLESLDILPVENKIGLRNGGWQTKDFDNVMTTYYISFDKKISVDTSSIFDRDEKIEPLNFTGHFFFYDLINDKFIEFMATCINGEVIDITQTLSQ